MKSYHAGSQNELVAAVWLMALGYEVFRNVSSCGPGDFVIWDPETDERHVIDVKGIDSKWKHRRSMPLSKSRTYPKANVLFLVVQDGEVSGFWRARSDGLPGTERYEPLAKQT